MAKKHMGSCACGSARFQFDTDPDFIALCHCLDCKKASGGEAAIFFGIPSSDFDVLSGELKSFSYVAQSGKGLDRNFCVNCGARLFTDNLESFPGMVFVQIAALDDPSGIAPKLEMFTKRRLPWMTPLGLPQFSDMPQ